MAFNKKRTVYSSKPLILLSFYMKILVIHGPNLNLLGSREPEKYGQMDSESILKNLQTLFTGHEISYFQSNNEGEIVDAIQQTRDTKDGLLINAGGFSHSSVAIGDAIRSVNLPSIAVHITNIFQREEYRQSDIVGDACLGTIAGLGTDGYALAMECLLDHLKR